MQSLDLPNYSTGLHNTLTREVGTPEVIQIILPAIAVTAGAILNRHLGDTTQTELQRQEVGSKKGFALGWACSMFLTIFSKNVLGNRFDGSTLLYSLEYRVASIVLTCLFRQTFDENPKDLSSRVLEVLKNGFNTFVVVGGLGSIFKYNLPSSATKDIPMLRLMLNAICLTAAVRAAEEIVLDED